MREAQEKLPDLPHGWAYAKIGEICNLVNGRAFKAEDWSSCGLPIIRIQNLNNHDAEFNYCSFDVEDKYYVDDGQLLFAWSGTPGTSFGAHIWNRGKGILNQHIFKVNINEQYLNKKFLVNVINYNVVLYIKRAHGTAGLAHITKGKFEDSFIPLPPLNEQHRIVARIEELFSRLDAGEQALRRARAQLHRYRQSVLQAAVEGRLTAEWREAHPEVEPAEKLLERIAKEKESSRSSRKIRRDSIIDDQSKILGKLPETWTWAKWGQIGISQNGRLFPSKEYQSHGYKLLRPGNLHSSGKVVWTIENTRYLDESWAKNFPSFIVGPRELVMNLTAQSLKDEFLGRICITGDSECCLLNQRIARLTPIEVLPEYLLWMFKSQVFRKFVNSLNTGSLIQHMFTSQLENFYLPGTI